MFRTANSKKKCKQRKINTLFTNGILTTQTQHTKYIRGRIKTNTKEWMECEGRNHLKPINVLINPYIGNEMKDVDTESFLHFNSYFHPISVISNFILRFSDWYFGIKVYDKDKQHEKTIKNFAIKISEMSLGQEPDLEAHQEKYQRWKKDNPNNRLILFGVSRGAATTFIAASKCPEVELVFLEGCFYSIDDVISRSPLKPAASFLSSGLSLFTNYKSNGPSPHKSINDFPPGIPAIFITSEKDYVVPWTSTKRLADELNARGKNDVYFLKLKKSSHPSYMFDDAEDNKRYESFVHAIYKRYGYHQYVDDAMAKLGEPLLKTCLLKKPAIVQQNATVPQKR